MKIGRPLSEVAAEIMRQAETKRDFVADTRDVVMSTIWVLRIGPPAQPRTDELRLNIGNETNDVGFTINRNAHQQIGARVGIPWKYYQKMLQEAGSLDLLASNVNHWFCNSPERRMVRTLDGTARAFLSDRYRPLDNYDIAKRLLPKLAEAQAEIVSCEITDKRFYIKAFTNEVQGEVKAGDVVRAGALIANSEVGHGSMQICPIIERLICKNGMKIADAGMKKYHVGRGNDSAGDSSYEFFRDETRQADDNAFWMKAEDTIDAVLKQDTFDSILDTFRASTETDIGDPIKAVEVVSDRLHLNETESHDVLKHLVAGGDLSTWGLANAITRCAEDVEDYDRATDVEGFGWSIVTGAISAN